MPYLYGGAAGTWISVGQGPGIHFSNPTEGYNYMWSNSFRNGEVWRENSGFLVEGGGLIVMPTEGQRYSKMLPIKKTGLGYGVNTRASSFNDFLPQEVKGSDRYVYLNGKAYKILAQIHTHPLSGTRHLSTGRSVGDEGYLWTTQGVSTAFVFGSQGVGMGSISGGTFNEVKVGSLDSLLNGEINLMSLVPK